MTCHNSSGLSPQRWPYFSRGKIWFDVLCINRSLLHVRNSDHDHVGPFHCFSCFEHFETLLPSYFNRLALFIESDDHIETTFLQIQGVCVSLRTKANNG